MTMTSELLSRLYSDDPLQRTFIESGPKKPWKSMTSTIAFAEYPLHVLQKCKPEGLSSHFNLVSPTQSLPQPQVQSPATQARAQPERAASNQLNFRGLKQTQEDHTQRLELPPILATVSATTIKRIHLVSLPRRTNPTDHPPHAGS
jgi:hypothetical protein